MSETKQDSTHFLQKYKDMINLRNDFNTIDLNNFLLPTMGEMVQEDLMSEILQDFIENEDYKDKEQGLLDESFYTEAPFTTSLGYHPLESVFMLRAKKLYVESNTWNFNKMDGDTTFFRLQDIDDGSEPFSFTNKIIYNSFKEYYNKMLGSDSITIRHLGLNCPEIPHIELQTVPGDVGDPQWQTVSMSFKELKALAKTNVSVAYLKYPPTNKERTEVKERKDEDIVKLLKVTTDEGKIAYKEILNEALWPGLTESMNGLKIDENANTVVLVSSDESEANTILDAYECQRLVKETLQNASDVLLMINANGINFGKTSTQTQMVYNSLYYTDDVIKFMLQQWGKDLGDIGQTNHWYRPYGTDTYTRSLGVVYVKQTKNNETRWINLNKMVLAKSQHSVANPSYTSSPELQAIGAGISDIFKTWSYDKDNLLYLDSFSSLSGKSYQEKLLLHKKLTGIDFSQTRNCSLMIGDTLMLIPPESIRNITQVFYERIPNIRSKGTMAKQVGQNEQMLELTLYFYEDAGINGIPYEITTPSGESLTYYMNGLRSLLAQFKIAPFLPIENGYINDVLGIEAVSMQNIYIQTVEGFPRLLKVILTLREFNYRTFMPDLPIDDSKDENDMKITELNPMFAKCFNWEIFRYYYQRSIMAGEDLTNMEFASYDHNLQFYTHKNTLQRFQFCSPPGMGSNISFYVPDEVWLQNALQVKKERDANLYTDTSYIDLSENAQEFLKQLNILNQRLSSALTDKNNDFYQALNEITKNGEEQRFTALNSWPTKPEKDYSYQLGLQECIKRRNIAEATGDETLLQLPKNEKRDIFQKMQTALLTHINDVNYMNALTVDELFFLNYDQSRYELYWDFNIHLNTTSLLATDLDAIKEVLIKNTPDNSLITMDRVFQDGTVKIRFKSYFEPVNTEIWPSKFEFPKEFKTGDVYVGELMKHTSLDGSDTYISLDTEAFDYIVLQQAESIITTNDPETGEEETDVSSNAHNKAIDFYVKDYKNPANMPFVPFLEDVPISSIASNTSNVFTEINLKAIEGVGPQFLGGQDTTIELEIITDDIVTVTMLNNLPTLASATAKKYRRILPSWPLKIRSEFTGLISVSEVLIDAIEVGTVEGFPGVYSVSMRLTSVDRTQRQREALRRLDVAPMGGNVDVSSSNLAINKYFAIESALSQAELYPDLDLPSLDEMAQLGWRFIKYAGDNRIYPDPDFYITYAYPYSSLIIKKTVKDVLSKKLLAVDGDEKVQSFRFSDVMGMSLSAKVESLLGISEIKETANSKAKMYEQILNTHKTTLEEKVEQLKWSKEKKNNIYTVMEELTIVNHLLMCDITDGWELKPGLSAPLCNDAVNQEILKLADNDATNNKYAQDLKDLRKQALECIDNILSKPLGYRMVNGQVEQDEAVASGSAEHKRPNDYQVICEEAVNEIFWHNSDGKKLLKLLCPASDIEQLDEKYPLFQNSTNTSTDYESHKDWYTKKFNESYFKDNNPLKFIAGYLFAAGCTVSGLEQYATAKSESKWHPNHYGRTLDISQTVYAKDVKKDKDGNESIKYPNTLMPYIEYDRAAGRTGFAEEIDAGVNNGKTFGAWRISSYASSEIDSMFMRESRSIVYNSEYKDELYKKTDSEQLPCKKVNNGFLDPYYNALVDNDKNSEIQTYKWNIALSKKFNAMAFIRVVLVHLKRMILDGLIFSEIDFVLEDIDYFYNTYVGDKPLLPFLDPSASGQTPIMVSDVSDELSVLGVNQDDMSELIREMKASFTKSTCARLIYPFLMAACEGDTQLYDLLKARDTNALSNLNNYVETGEQTYAAGKMYKFMSALAGCELITSNNDANESTASIAQQMMNNMMKDVYIQAAEDPRAYLLHSFYDMLVNDKRGRLVRAFPTYYFILIDEGRKIGSWKLHDNFYNMNSISEIQVVKSRKIAADTCTITLNNMFNSYTTETDITTTQQYLDIYGLRDVFHSIFSPQSYFNKEKALRLRQAIPDTVQLQPGVRMHVRMGYSGDASKLPIVFNGKIAEVEVGDVAQIIAQGDGHELMNPLNALGELEATSLDPSQTMCTWFKDLRGSLARGGESPRDLLAKLLTAKHGGWKKVANEMFDGRWFNENPFGIMHFGDPKYNHIFDLGEPVQNLYEVSDTQLLRGVNQIWSDDNPRKSTPIINTSIEDKTLWDILHLCANSGLGYIGAIRDFGFRSTVFLGKPNHYYAYAYTLVDNKVVEKRKPFQQFHYYDSYNDIIYNAIKASEAQMKTNAVGIWQASSAWWGREQSTVGPIYLDMNIYPEYQKSMTVDTGLLADGNGLIDVPFITHFSEKWAMNPNDDKVNKELAWRVTANTLRDSVKDMYLGDVGIIGDPSVKPHDRVYIHDTYEDMQGMFEVEAVVHNMSVQNGFTTSIMPDVIARHQDEMEVANQGLLNNVGLTLFTTVSSNVAFNLWTAAVNNKLTISLAKSKAMYGATTKLIQHSKNIANAAGMLEYLEKHPVAKQFFSNLTFIGENNLNLNWFTTLIEGVAGWTPAGKWSDDLAGFAQAFMKFSDLDIEKFGETMMDIHKSAQYGSASSLSEADVKKAVEEMQSTYRSLFKQIDKSLSNINLATVIDDINKLGIVGDVSPETKKLIELLMKNADVDNITKAKHLASLLSDEVIASHLTNKNLVVDGLDELGEKFVKMVTDKDNGLKSKTILKALKGGDAVQDLLSVVVKFAKTNWAVFLLDAAFTLVTEIFIRNTKEMFARWLREVQAIDVYPLKRNGKPLVAGMNGHKGSVAMYPVHDGYNSIQGMVLEAVDTIDQWSVFGWHWGKTLRDWFIVDENILQTVCNDWRQDLGIIDPEIEGTTLDPSLNFSKEDSLQDVYNDMGSNYSNRGDTANKLITMSRIPALDKDDDGEIDMETYEYYELKGLNTQALTLNEKLQKLYYIEHDDVLQKAMAEDKLIVAHKKNTTAYVTINFESGDQRIPVLMTKNSTVIDMPLVQEEIIFILKKLVINDDLTGKIHFKSGTRVNDDLWNNTGFRCILEYQGKDKRLTKALEDLREETSYKEVTTEKNPDGSFKTKKRYMFKCIQTKKDVEGADNSLLNWDSKYIIIVYPPSKNTESQ